MSINSFTEDGFSAVETLITLFIAVLFIIAGNQLYTYVMKNGAESDQQARASNVGYEYLRSKAPAATSPCTDSSPQNYTNEPVSGLSNVNITLDVSCPYSSATSGDPRRNISEVTVTVKYGGATPQLEVQHAVFVKP
ncbi:MAG TPA: hypothetical protein VGE34_03265 [Candidatus Saccharimonadales bacterium]